VELCGEVGPEDDGDLGDEDGGVEEPGDVAEREDAEFGGGVALDEVRGRKGERSAVRAAFRARLVEVLERDRQRSREDEQTQEIRSKPANTSPPIEKSSRSQNTHKTEHFFTITKNETNDLF